MFRPDPNISFHRPRGLRFAPGRTSVFTKAGRELGLSQPSVPTRLAELEAEVGAALFVRSTRAVTLTEAGVDYVARVEAILSALDEAEHAARGSAE